MRLSKQELIDRYLDARVRYAKRGSRHGWEGRVTFITTEMVTVLYDNGHHQEYRLDALHQNNPSFGHKWSTYLDVINYSDDSDTRSQTVGKYVVVDAELCISEHFDDEESAITFATEQVVDAGQFKKLTVFKAMTVVSTRMPEVVVEPAETSEPNPVDQPN